MTSKPLPVKISIQLVLLTSSVTLEQSVLRIRQTGGSSSQFPWRQQHSASAGHQRSAPWSTGLPPSNPSLTFSKEQTKRSRRACRKPTSKKPASPRQGGLPSVSAHHGSDPALSSSAELAHWTLIPPFHRHRIITSTFRVEGIRKPLQVSLTGGGHTPEYRLPNSIASYTRLR